MCDAGLLTQVSRDGYRITHAGHDFLDVTRNAGIWQSTKEHVAKAGGSATLEMVKQVAVAFAKKKFKDFTDLEL